MSIINVCWNRGGNPTARLMQESMLSAQSGLRSGNSFRWSDEQISLGGTLSSFLPEDQFDRQPVWNADKSFCLVADVRVDNRAELANKLNLNHPEELADSAFLAAAWERWEAVCLDHVIGGFAFAVWTPSRQELFVARDHAGERPLFYHRGEHLFAVASMPKGLLALPGLSRGFDQTRLVDCLGAVPPDWTTSFFEEIKRVPPGHFLRVTPHSFECKRYWHPTDARPTHYKRDEEYTEALLEIFDRATEARLRSIKPVGSFLSSGLDSSSVTASAARLLDAQGKGLTAFTAVPRPEFNNIAQPWFIASEGAAAAEVARLYPNVEHVLVDTAGRDLLGTMKTWTDAMSEPAFNVVNFLWITEILNRARQRGIGVMLSGVSGNATISWETHAILGYFFRRLRWGKLLKTTLSLRDHGDISFRAAIRASLGGFMPEWGKRKLIPDSNLKALYSPLINPELARSYDLQARIFENHYFDASDLVVERSRLFEFADFGPINAATEAVTGVSVRDPTGDKRIYDFCFSIPPEQYVAGGESRSLARRAMKGRLPESVLNCYKVGLQAADWYLTVGEALPALRNEAALMEQSPAARHTLDLPRLHDLLDTWPDSGFEKKEISYVWDLALSRAIGMGHFLRTHDPAVTGGVDEAHAVDLPTVS
jgi:asparagine synthase (glutamine-hydrolysing)